MNATPNEAARPPSQRTQHPYTARLEMNMNIKRGLLQIEWVIFVILRAIPVFDGDAIADWDW
jgi:hypothetical protein